MKKILFAIFLTACSLNASAQYISPFFTSMPDDIFNYLSANNRKDLVDLFKAGKTASVENLLKGKTGLTELSDDLLTLKLSESATAQMKLLPLNDTVKVIAIVQTVSGNAKDSRIQFFTSMWNKIEVAEVLPPVTLNDFINKEAWAEKNDPSALAALDVTFFSYSFSKNSNELTVSLDAENYLSKEDYKRIAPLLKPVCKFNWKDGKFVKQ